MTPLKIPTFINTMAGSINRLNFERQKINHKMKTLLERRLEPQTKKGVL